MSEMECIKKNLCLTDFSLNFSTSTDRLQRFISTSKPCKLKNPFLNPLPEPPVATITTELTTEALADLPEKQTLDAEHDIEMKTIQM